MGRSNSQKLIERREREFTGIHLLARDSFSLMHGLIYRFKWNDQDLISLSCLLALAWLIFFPRRALSSYWQNSCSSSSLWSSAERQPCGQEHGFCGRVDWILILLIGWLLPSYHSSASLSVLIDQGAESSIVWSPNIHFTLLTHGVYLPCLHRFNGYDFQVVSSLTIIPRYSFCWSSDYEFKRQVISSPPASIPNI